MKNNWMVLLFCFTICFVISENSLAQYMRGTLITVGENGLTQKIGISREQQIIKDESDNQIGLISEYSGELQLPRGTTVEIRQDGGLFKNIKYSKGKALIIESIVVNGISIERELSYLDGIPTVTKCEIGHDNTKRQLIFSQNYYIDLLEPKVFPWLKVKKEIMLHEVIRSYSIYLMVFLLLASLFTYFGYRLLKGRKILKKGKVVTTHSNNRIEDDTAKWNCPKCHNDNPNTTYNCLTCGYSLK